MAKFDVLYPNHETGLNQKPIEFEGSELIKSSREPQPCWHCQEETTWIDIIFQAYLCSEECERAKWKEYFRAVRLNKNGV